MAILRHKSANPTTRIVQSLVTGVSLLFLSCSISLAQVMFQDDFASGNLSKTQNGFRWQSSVRSVVVDFQGSKALRMRYNGVPAGQDSFTEQRFTLGNYYSDVWIKYDMYVPSNYFMRGTLNDKSYLYLWTDNYSGQSGVGGGFQNWGKSGGGSTLMFVEWSGAIPRPHLVDAARLPSAFDAHKGKWVEIIANLKAGTGSGDGSGRLWRDGILVYVMDATTWGNRYPLAEFLYAAGKNNRFNNGYLLGWSNNGFDTNTDVYIDNFIFSTTPLISFDPPNAPIGQ